MNFNFQKYQAAFFDLPNTQIQTIPLLTWDTLLSTNQKLWELIEQKQQLPLAIIALEQTAGRGQWGRQWVSARGGLYFSVGMTCNLAVNDSFLLSLVIGWGIATALRNYNLPVLLKWPNDLILVDKKLGGIKLETRSQTERITEIVIGVGINWSNTVPEVGINLQSYYQQRNLIGITSLEQLSAITLSGIILGYQSYLEVESEQLLNNYLKLFANLGQKVSFNGSIGIITGVTTQGQLRVRLQSPGAATEVCLSPGQISLGYQENKQ